MAPIKKVKVPAVDEAELVTPHEVLLTAFDFSQKENLLALHKIITDLNVRSIGDLENLIARAE